MKHFLKDNKIEILIGVISSLIVSMILKGLGFIASTAPAAGKTLISAFVDSIYRDAAEQSAVALLENLFLFLMGTLLGAFIAVTLSLVIAARKTTSRKHVSRGRKNVKENSADGNGNVPKTKEETISRLRKRINYTSVASIILVIILYAMCYYCFFYPAKLFHKFEVDIIRVAPYISSDEEELLRSQWTLMQSKDDYLVIDSTIQEIYNQNGLLH